MFFLDVKQLMLVQISSTKETLIYSINILKSSVSQKSYQISNMQEQKHHARAKPLAFKRQNRLNEHRSTIHLINQKVMQTM